MTPEVIPSSLGRFRINVQVHSLPFFLDGQIPEEPKTICWTLYTPKRDSAGYLLTQKPTTTYDGDIILNTIKSETDEIDDPHYRDALGVGSFLLDNFLELADIKGWRVTLVSLYTGVGRLKQEKLDSWYRKRGFVAHHETMIREPQPPSGQTEIARITNH